MTNYLEVSEKLPNFATASKEVSQLYGASIAGRFFSPLSFYMEKAGQRKMPFL